MQQRAWIISQVPEPAKTSLVGEVSGMYTALINGLECVLNLWHWLSLASYDSHGFVHGALSTEEETLKFRGDYSPKTGEVQGYVFEPFGMLPVATLTAQQTVQGLSAQMRLLEFEHPREAHQTEQVIFSRVLDPDYAAEEVYEELMGSYC